MAEGQNFGPGAERDVAQHAVRADAHAIAELDTAFEQAIHIDDNVASAFERAAYIDASRIGEAHALVHQALCFATLERTLKRRQLGLGIHAGDFIDIVDLDRDDTNALFHRERDDIGQVVLLLSVAVADFPEPSLETLAAQRHEARIDFADSSLLGLRVFFFDDAFYVEEKGAKPEERAIREINAGFM